MAVSVGWASEVCLVTAELEPVILLLQAAHADLQGERIEAAWVELDIAEARLRFQSSQPGSTGPLLEKTLRAVERTRDHLGRAQTRQACATLAAAVGTLLATLIAAAARAFGRPGTIAEPCTRHGPAKWR